MTLRDFLNKYKKIISRKEVCEKIGISYQRLNILERGGAHTAITKYAPIIEALIPNCKDKIYIPPKEDPTVGWKRVEKVRFTDAEIEELKRAPYAIHYRTRLKILNGHLFSRKVHDKLMAQIRGEVDISIKE